MTKKPDNPISAYLAAIGKRGGEASGVARRQIRDRHDAGTLTAEERQAYEVRREQARKAAEKRWSTTRRRDG